MTTRVSVGILAHDESARIERSLGSLFEQGIFGDDGADLDVEVVVVPNGCKDDTATKARATLRSLTAARTMPHVRWKVCEVAERGKSRSWNVFVHELSDPQADFLILMDADIEILDERSLGSLVRTLEQSPEAAVSVGDGVKDIALRERKGLVPRLSLAASSACKSEYTWISGQLYCGRAAELRKIWMPIGLPVEDGYLWTMVVTERHTKPINGKRVIAAPDARHVFEAELNPFKLLRHEKRIVLGMSINSLIGDYLRAHSTPERDAGLIVRDENARNPNWLGEAIDQSIAGKDGPIIPLAWIFRRSSSLRDSLRSSPMPKRLVLFPAIALAFNADVFVFVAAYLQLKSGQGVGFW